MLQEMNETDYIERALTKFKLVDIKEQYLEIIEEAIQNKVSYKKFLIQLLECEEEPIV